MGRIEDNLIQDASSPETVTGDRLELSTDSCGGILIDQLSSLHNALIENQPVTAGQLGDFRKSLEEIRVKFGEENFSLAELKPNLPIFKEMEEGNARNVGRLTILPISIAKLIEDRRWRSSLDFKNLKSIKIEVAKALSSLPGDLNLDGLESLGPGVANALIAKKRGHISLGGLSSLPADFIDALAEERDDYPTLLLDGVISITDEQAEVLSKINVYLRGLTSLSDAGFRSFTTNNPNREIHFDGLTSISDESAAILGGSKVSEVWLDGVKSLSPAAAASLARGGFVYLSLRGLVDISPEVAGLLAKSESNLRLFFPRPLDELVASALSTSAPSLNLDFPRPATLSLEVIKKLAQKKDSLNINAPGVILSDEAFLAFSQYQGYHLTISGISFLTEAGAQSFANFKGRLSLDIESPISEKMAEILSNKKSGELWLDNKNMDILRSYKEKNGKS